MDSASAEKAVLKAVHSSGVKAGSESGLMLTAGVVVIAAVGVVWLITVMQGGADQKTQVLEAQLQTKDATLEQIKVRDARAAQQQNAGMMV